MPASGTSIITFPLCSGSEPFLIVNKLFSLPLIFIVKVSLYIILSFPPDINNTSPALIFVHSIALNEIHAFSQEVPSLEPEAYLFK
jgi:hypothetical protein